MTATPEAIDLASVAARAASDRLAEDILVIDVSDRMAITDCFVIATGDNERMVNSIVDEVEEADEVGDVVRGIEIDASDVSGLGIDRWRGSGLRSFASRVI